MSEENKESKEPITVTLNNIIPEKASLDLFLVGEDGSVADEPISVTLNPCTLEDEAWLARHYSEEQIKDIFTNVKMVDVTRIVYRLMAQKDRMLFCAMKLETVNDEGEKETRNITGPQRVMMGIRGTQHKTQVFQALLTTLGYSRPILDAIERAQVEDESKKKVGA